MSDSSAIPGAVEDFIVRHIESVEQLEVLALLVENPRSPWSPQEVFRKIQSSQKSIQTCLEKFLGHGLIKQTQPGHFQILGSDELKARDAALLVETYRQRPVKVVECIYGKSSTSIQGFADAFKLRREK